MEWEQFERWWWWVVDLNSESDTRVQNLTRRRFVTRWDQRTEGSSRPARVRRRRTLTRIPFFRTGTVFQLETPLTRIPFFRTGTVFQLSRPSSAKRGGRVEGEGSSTPCVVHGRDVLHPVHISRANRRSVRPSNAQSDCRRAPEYPAPSQRS